MKIERFDSAKFDTQDIACKLKEILELCYGESPWSESYLLSNLKRDIYFLAEVDDELVGFLAVQVVMEELMDQVADFAGTLFLEVRESNKPAQNLYKKYNFEAFYTRKNYYSHPTEDAILMRKIQ